MSRPDGGAITLSVSRSGVNSLEFITGLKQNEGGDGAGAGAAGAADSKENMRRENRQIR